jgi:hypothetical protein
MKLYKRKDPSWNYQNLNGTEKIHQASKEIGIVISKIEQLSRSLDLVGLNSLSDQLAEFCITLDESREQIQSGLTTKILEDVRTAEASSRNLIQTAINLTTGRT